MWSDVAGSESSPLADVEGFQFKAITLTKPYARAVLGPGIGNINLTVVFVGYEV